MTKKDNLDTDNPDEIAGNYEKGKKKIPVLPPGIAILVHENGVLRIWDKDDFKPYDWQYRVIDKSDRYMLIDLDKEKAAPLVKSILNDLDLFPELRMLRLAHWLLYLVIFLSFIFPAYIAYFWAKTDGLAVIQKTLEEMKASPTKKPWSSIEDQSGIFKAKIQQQWTQKSE